jgi:hypothetical protein
MLNFKQFLFEEHGPDNELHLHPILHNFLHHLSSPTIHPEEVSLEEAHSIEHIQQHGKENAPSGNLFSHLREGFHSAFPEGEHPDVTKRKAQESRKHFRNWMHERGGLAAKNTANLTSENGKTRLSTGEGVQTIGVSLAPHSSSGYKHNLCPKASSECKKNCLGFTAGGNKQYPEAAFRAKLLRTHYMAEHPEHYARLMSHEIGENEKWSDKHGYKAGFRPNVTSDVPYEHLMPKKFFDKHHKTQFYDYTKIASRLKNKDLPKNYSLALSHTGANHEESNDKDVVHALENGHVVAMVHQKLKKNQKQPTHVEDVQTGRRWKLVNGDEDDNVYDRHKAAGISKKEGVVSGLKLKGVKNEAAGHFANKVDDDGIIRINHPTTPKKKTIPIAKA